MYTPSVNRVKDRSLLLEAMRSSSFAALCAASPFEAGETLIATHLPLLIEDEGPHGCITGHFAMANLELLALDGHEVLVIFQGPNSYVSPRLYANPFPVPTWNYIAIHASGKLQALHDNDEKEPILKGLMNQHEPEMALRWNELPDDQRLPLLNAICGFRLLITSIDGKFKLSQNRSQEDQLRIHAAHSVGDPDQRALADWMLKTGQLHP